MEYYKKYICVTVEELTRKGDGEAIMSIENYKTLVKRRRVNVVRPGKGLGNYALIDYNSLPERFRDRFVEKYGKPADILKSQAIIDTFIEDTAAREFFADHILPDGTRLPADKIDEYTTNASVLNEIIKLENDREALKKALGSKAGSVKQSILNTLEKFRDYPGHSLPGSWARVQKAIKAYREDGYVSVISGRMGNNNAIKITEAAGLQIVALKRSKVPQYTNEQLFTEYNRIAPEKGWKPLKSINSLVQFLNRPEIEPLWYDAVHGELAAKQRYTRKNKTEMPSLRDSLWYGDGTKLNLYYKAYDAKGKTVMCSTQVYEVIDAFSEVLLGYHISDTENYEAQYRAFRMAVETAGHRPFEVVTDNQGGHKKLESMQFFDRLARVTRRTAPYNPQSKSIEQAFGRFQAQFLHKDWRFTGQNITAKRSNSRPNLEFIEANVEHLYTLPELKEAYARYREEWNLAAHPATKRPRLEMYKASVNPEARALAFVDMVDLFWNTTDQPSTFTSNGITITVDKKEYTYEVYDSNNAPDLDFRDKNTYRQFIVKYDPLDMSSVRLYTEDKNGLRFVATAYPYYVTHRAIQEQQPGEMKFLQEMDERNKQARISRQILVAGIEMAHGVAPEQHGLNRPRIKGMKAEAVEAYMGKAEPVSVGVMEKAVSNYTYDQVSAFDKF
ncbi:transposase family protein [Bacteroidales bacterium OttesenSCG-928-J19]|nr:transposase family protein [Bacteroidales bacterium OttesenSCG-928-J19]